MESLLKETRAYNVEHSIFASENKVIDRLLKRSVEMQSVYRELTEKLNVHQKRSLCDALLGAAAFWNPEVSKALREDKKKLAKLNIDIEKHANKLAELIQERENISDTSGISSFGDYHFLYWVHRAAKNNYYYQNYVKGGLDALKCRFDLKYWPTNHEVIAAIGELAHENEIYEVNEWTEELLSSPKHSMSDYLRVILKAIDDRKAGGGYPPGWKLPEGFRLSDNSLATLINCTLDIEPEKLLSAENIKRARQNIRSRKFTS